MDSDGVLQAVEKTGFTLIAIAGIKDIIRREVPEAVAICQKAGIIVRMVTGDNQTTAMTIAQECGIITPDLDINNDIVLEGKTFADRVEGLYCKNCRNAIP